jgi:DNA polymerase-4
MNRNYPKNGRVILHVDMNAFYCSVHTSHEPDKYLGKPIAVGGNVEERRGILVTASYECRAKGVKAAMPIWQARKLCPEMIVLTPNFDLYRRYSQMMLNLLYQFTPQIEPASIDEAYMDITGCGHMGTPLEIADRIQNRLQDELRLPCSIGIAPNKFLAKMASDLRKPNAINVLRKRDVKTVLWPKPVRDLHGVGKKMEERLHKLGIHTIGDLANTPADLLCKQFGKVGMAAREHAHGNDGSIVDPNSIYEIKTIGNSTTLRYDTDETEVIKQVLTNLADTVAGRMRKKGYMGENIQLTIRYADWKTATRSCMTLRPVETTEEIYEYALQLFNRHWSGLPVRLLGISTHKLIEKENAVIQLDIFTFDRHERKEKLIRAVDLLKEKHGDHILMPLRQKKQD